MGREIRIYQALSGQIRKDLFPKLMERPDSTQSFAAFLRNRKADFGDSYQIDPGQFLLKLVADQPQPLLPEEVFEITYWLEEEAGQTSEAFGLPLLYATKSKADANGMAYWFYTFLDRLEEEGEAVRDDSGARLTPTDFRRFLAALLLLFAQERKTDFISADHRKELNTLPDFHGTDMIVSGFLKTASAEARHMIGEVHLPEINFISRSAELIPGFLDLYQSVGEEGIVFVLDLV